MTAQAGISYTNDSKQIFQMEYIVITLCVIGIGAYFAVRRGITTVRAAMYLIYLEEGYSVDDATGAILGTGYSDVAKYQNQLIARASAPFGGSQLKMLAKARQMGFRE